MADIYYPVITNDSLMDERILDAYTKTEEMEKDINECEKEFDNTQVEDDRSPCDTMKTVNKWTDITKKISGIISSISGSIKLFSGFENSIAAQIILKRIQKILLYAKRLILKIKLKIAVFTKKMVLAMINGNGSKIPDSTSTAINLVFSALGTAVNILLISIDAFITTISVSPIGIGPQSVILFATPKSMNNTKASANNPNSAIGDRLPLSVKKTFHAIEKSISKANKAIKIATIAAGAVSGASAILSDNPTFGKSAVFNKLRPGELQKEMEKLSDYLPIPMGMPRYEKLKLTNMGFMTYLITGFEPAAHKSFGIPGYF